MRAKAFSPGHITGFFEICRSDDLMSTGSRGAGLCTDLGASSTVSVDAEGRRGSIGVTIDGEEREAEVTRRAIERLASDRPLHVQVDTTLQLPESQGFGMSAAGALSACLAFAHLEGIDRQRAFEAAHSAEVECGAGLGDVPAIYRSGVTVRELPGLPPIGRVHRIEEAPEVVLAVVGPPMKTSAMLTDAALVDRINRSGTVKVGELLAQPSVAHLMRLARDFASETGLAQGPVAEAIDAASAAGDASMVMLGNSVFAMGRTEELISILRERGEVRRCGVDVKGARVVN